MKKEDAFFLLLIILFLLGILLTMLFGPKQGRHGYGAVDNLNAAVAAVPRHGGTHESASAFKEVYGRST